MDSLLSRSPTHTLDSPVELKVLAEWSPLMEISQTDKDYFIKAELPGLTSHDVKVSVESGTLTISGQRKFVVNETVGKHHMLAPVSASFGRTFSLPSDANPARFNAEVTDGILIVRIAKSEQAVRPNQPFCS
jgi:HSP20 family protein